MFDKKHASGHTLALSSAIIANLIRCLAEVTVTKIDPHQNSPLWVFQLLLQVYFTTLRPEIPSFKTTEAFGLQLASGPAFLHSTEEVFKYFFGLENLSNEFLIYRRQEYPSSIKISSSAWDKTEDADLGECSC